MTVDAPELAEIYDVMALLENTMGDGEIAEELLDRFHSRLVSGRQSLETHVEEGDFIGAASIAHSLKGEAGILAACQVHHAAEQLELALQSPEETAVLSLVSELRVAVERCLDVHAEAHRALRELQLSDG